MPRLPGELATDPYVATWSNVPAGTYVITARATDDGGGTGTSPDVTVTVLGPGARATGFRTDVVTRGSWQSVYGSQGYVLANDASSPPLGATITLSGQVAYTWVASTSDVRALQHPSGVGRQAATWFSATSFTMDVNFTDVGTHAVGLYLLDWDADDPEKVGRAERIDVLDAGNGAVLDSHVVSGFGTGQYVTWDITGHVIFRITRTGGPNAVVSGLFF